MFFRFVRNLRNFRRSFASPNFYRASLIKTAVLINSAQQDKENPPKFKDFFTGADAVVHLAWQIQPSRDRAQMRRTNIDGTRAVVIAARRAGVPGGKRAA